MSNVLRQIKSTDVYQRPFKAYKNYKDTGSLLG